VDALAAALWFWLAWRTIRTGLPAGNPRGYGKKERPLQFWLAAIGFPVMGTWYALRAAGF
jgi:hypothetical protein